MNPLGNHEIVPAAFNCLNLESTVQENNSFAQTAQCIQPIAYSRTWSNDSVIVKNKGNFIL